MTKSSKSKYKEFRKAIRKKGFADKAHKHDESTEQKSGINRRWHYVRQYLHWLRPFSKAIVFVICLSVLKAILSLALPRATMYIVDELIPAQNWILLNIVGGAVLLFIFLKEAVSTYGNIQIAKLNARVIYQIRQKLYNHVIQLPLHYLSKLKTGGITSRLSGDVDAITGLVQMAVISPISAGIQVLFTLGMLFFISWEMGAALLLLLPPLALVQYYFFRRIRPLFKSIREDRQEIDARVVETFSGIRVVRAYRREKTEARTYAIGHHTVVRKDLFTSFMTYANWFAWDILIPICSLATIWVGGALVMQGQIKIGAILAFQILLFMALEPINVIMFSYAQTQQGLAAMERIFDLLAQPTDKPDRPDATNAPRDVESLRFENVSFGYDKDQAVLKDITLEVKGGSTVALVGASGSGKSTLINLIARFYDPVEGVIRLNGVDLRNLKLMSYRDLLAIVQQETFLFDGSVAENIAYGRRGVTQEEIEDAVKRANAHDFIMEFADKFDTLVGERGVKLSGGQAQRISIARAILADPKILILDEATSNLDSESEHLIQASLEELLENRTTFIIAHRLSTITHADMIVVLDKGRIVETGKHAELMASSTLYRKMVKRQQRNLELFDDKAEPDAVADLIS